tara:strand:- start:413 stop:907 length:495 start_codon:yes stop_codon:yes gene_type:complete
MSDPRSLASELYAFSYLGLPIEDMIVSERELIDNYGTQGMNVPEAIFTVDNQRITVEVKRIPGNNLPDDGSPRRSLRRRNRIIWPWTSTVERALKKTSPLLSFDYDIVCHHVVFVIPDTLARKKKMRLHNHVNTAVDQYKNDDCVHPNIRVHIIDGPLVLFDRL